ncbi:asparagine synthase-related protein [Micromonospora chersina]|uniref:asparagine synthase-related protein n=1 Tax=Micromonospora chersina TaxID=47854 RepID=UPI00378E1B52
MQFCRDLLAVTVAPGCTAPAPVAPFGGLADCHTFDGGKVWTRAVGPELPSGGDAQVFALSLGPRDHDFRPVDSTELAARLLSGAALGQLAAPFAAAALTATEFVAATDHVGLRHLYAAQGEGWAAVSTSALELARLAGAPVDRPALAAFAATGFYLGEATPFQGVQKLPAGTRTGLAKGVLEISRYPVAAAEEPEPAGAVTAMADLLRGSVERCLDRHPDTVFELSGGFDSRLLFAAVPPERRAGLRTLTLATPGGADAAIAGALATRYGTRHQVIDLARLGALPPAAAYALVTAAARRHDTVGSPVALGVLDWVESQVEPGVRINGQGGEACRGSYHMGQRQHPRPDPALVDRLARWWFMTNEAVNPKALVPDFAERAQAQGIAAIRAAFAAYDTDWFTAIDHFFLNERVHRWVGINFSGACLDRTIVSIYLDPRFLAIAHAVPPSVRGGSGFAARVLERLDRDLALVPLATGVRPKHLPRRYVPRALAEYSVARYVRRGGEKLLQFARREAQTAAGTPALADLVVRHWREHPELVEPALRIGIVREEWLIGLLAGRHGADAATVGFLVNLAVAAEEQTPVSAG